MILGLNFIKAMQGFIKFRSTPDSKRRIIFYSENENYFQFLEGPIRSALEISNLKIAFISSSNKDPGLQLAHKNLKCFYIGSGFVRDTFFRYLESCTIFMTMPDIGQSRIKVSDKKVTYAFLQHSMCSLHMIYKKNAFDNFDILFCSGPHQYSEARMLEKYNNSNAKKLVKLGYSKIDRMTNKHLSMGDNEKQVTRNILIAPSWGKSNLLDYIDINILVTKLISKGFKVTLKPHPEDLKYRKNLLDKVRKKFLTEDAFTYSINSDNFLLLRNNGILITDWSGISIEYAFTFKRPVIFADTPKKINNNEFDKLPLKPIEDSIREEIGLIWYTYCDISVILEKIKKFDSSKIEQSIEKHLYNFKQSDLAFQRFLNSIQYK